MKFLKSALLCGVVVATLAGCSSRVSVHGNYPRPEQLSMLEKGKANKRAIQTVLGPPTTVGTFDQDSWYYITQQFETFAFFAPEMTDMRVYAFYFDENGIYTQDQTYTLDDLQNIAMTEETTPTAGEEVTFLRQMFGNFGRFTTN